jgi:hypothetical protein
MCAALIVLYEEETQQRGVSGLFQVLARLRYCYEDGYRSGILSKDID